jgi:hypothetical protein
MKPSPNQLANLNRFRRGFTITAKGYARYTAGKLRNKLVHRVVMEKIIGGPIPPGMTVEHLDHRRAHNCWQNLMLLDARIHNYISWDSIRARDEEATDWVNAA